MLRRDTDRERFLLSPERVYIMVIIGYCVNVTSKSVNVQRFHFVRNGIEKQISCQL